jgi:hypothetical protein
MAKESAKKEEAVLKRMLPWLSSELKENLQWLGSPEDPSYCSRCPGANLVSKPLDGEVAGPQMRMAIEHTTIESYLTQRARGAAFKGLRAEIQVKRKQVPRGQHVDIAIPNTLAHGEVTRRQVQIATPPLLKRLDDYLHTLDADPPRQAVVRGHLLEEPQTWHFGAIDFRIFRFWFPGSARLSLVELHDPTDASTRLDQSMAKALVAKISGKEKTYQIYKGAGWRTLLVLELIDFFLSSLDDVAESFRRLCPTVSLALLDDVVLMQQIANGPIECCWAYRSGQIRSPDQQHSELARCLGLP